MNPDQKQRRKIGHIVQRGNSWYVPVYLSRQLVRNEATGEEKWKERRRWMRFASYREARAALPGLSDRAHKRTLAKSTTEKVADYLPRWLTHHARNIAEKTHYDYEKMMAKHIVPALGRFAVRDLEPEQIDAYLTAKLREGLSPTSVHHHFTLLHKAFEDAVRKRQLPSNPCEAVDRPKRAKPEIRFLDDEQLRVFLGTAKRTSRYYRLYLVAALSGLRQSELCGLKWENVDLATGQIAVQRVFYRLAGRKIWKEPKSVASRRSITLSPELVEELRVLRREQDDRRKQIGKLYQDHGLVFCQEDGKPLHGHNITRRDLRRVLKEAKMPRRITFHGLRHSFASLLLRHGTHMKVAQSLLGHSSIGVTMDRYSHLQPSMQDEAIREASKRLLGSVGST